MKYDDASWHAGDDFPADLPETAGATHIGMFLAWALLRGLGNQSMHGPAAIARLRDRAVTGAAYLIAECDGKLTDGDPTDPGNNFARFYYGHDPGYLNDYDNTFRVDAYRVDDTWANFDRLAPVLDRRYREWQGLPPDARPLGIGAARAALAAGVKTAVIPALVAFGFRSRYGKAFRNHGIDLTHEILFSLAERDDTFGIDAQISIRCPAAEPLARRLLDKTEADFTTLVRDPIAFDLPYQSRPCFDFSTLAELDVQIEQLTTFLIESEVPFLDSHGDIAHIVAENRPGDHRRMGNAPWGPLVTIAAALATGHEVEARLLADRFFDGWIGRRNDHPAAIAALAELKGWSWD